uniref:Protein kinase domain-containing protein n=1 Tax=Gouania willdenowi TaxID=441366 RepID=A0A8C5I7X9_GOUWI
SALSVYDKFMGEGSFGKVAKCQNKSTCEIVAVKILKDEVKDDLILLFSPPAVYVE